MTSFSFQSLNEPAIWTVSAPSGVHANTTSSGPLCASATRGFGGAPPLAGALTGACALVAAGSGAGLASFAASLSCFSFMTLASRWLAASLTGFAGGCSTAARAGGAGASLGGGFAAAGLGAGVFGAAGFAGAVGAGLADDGLADDGLADDGLTGAGLAEGLAEGLGAGLGAAGLTVDLIMARAEGWKTVKRSGASAAGMVLQGRVRVGERLYLALDRGLGRRD